MINIIANQARIRKVKENPFVDVYFVAGQSNAEGVGTVSELTGGNSIYSAEQRALMYTKTSDDSLAGVYQRLKAGVNQQYQSNILFRFRPEISLGYHLGQYRPNNVIICKYALTSTPLLKASDPTKTAWEKSAGEMYPKLLNNFMLACTANLRSLGFQPVAKGFLWMQGEQDCLTLSGANQYEAALNLFINNIIADTNFKGLKFAIGRLHNNFTNQIILPEAVGIIRQAQVQVSSSNKYCLPYIDTDGFGLNADNTHYSTQGELDLGFQAYLRFKDL